MLGWSYSFYFILSRYSKYELLHDFNFVLKACGVLNFGLGDGLDGSGSLGDLVGSFKNCTITSCAQNLIKLRN